MKNLQILFFLISTFLVLNACQTVTTKIDKTTEQEKKELSQWLNKSEADLKIFFGQPDKVEFLKTRNRNYIYISLQYKCNFFSWSLKTQLYQAAQKNS